MNKDKVQNQNILGTLVNKDESGIIAYSDQIYDKKSDRSLEEENVKQNERLDNVEAKDREFQSTLENITKTGEASAASNVTYNHSDSKLDATNVQQAIDEVSSMAYFAKRGAVVNISTNYNSTNTTEVLTLEQAIAKVPSSDRVLGFQGKFLTSEGWKLYMFTGDSISDWSDISKWIEQISSAVLAQELGDSTSKAISQNAVTKKIIELDDKVSTQLPKIEEAKNEALNNIKENEQSAITNFNSQRVTPEMLSESTKQLIEASGGGTITNLADDEDITSVDDGIGSNVLKFADRTYNPDNFSGKGYKILRKNIIGDKNVLTQSMINQPNTIYVIQYDFTLDENITIPANCVLQFEGGSISAGSGENMNTITGNNTEIKAGLIKIFETNLTIGGTWSVIEIYPEWFGAKGDGVTDDTNIIQKSIYLSYCTNQRSSIVLSKNYAVTQIVISDNEIHLVGSISANKAKLVGIQANTSIIYITGVSQGTVLENFTINAKYDGIIGIFSEAICKKHTTAGLWYAKISNIRFNNCDVAIKMDARDDRVENNKKDVANQYFIIDNCKVHGTKNIDVYLVGQVGQNSIKDCYFEPSNSRNYYIYINTNSTSNSDGSSPCFKNCSFVGNPDKVVMYATGIQYSNIEFHECWFEGITKPFVTSKIQSGIIFRDCFYNNCKGSIFAQDCHSSNRIRIEGGVPFGSYIANAYDGVTMDNQSCNIICDNGLIGSFFRETTDIIRAGENCPTLILNNPTYIEDASNGYKYCSLKVSLSKHSSYPYNIVGIKQGGTTIGYFRLGQIINLIKQNGTYFPVQQRQIPLYGTSSERNSVINTEAISIGFQYFDTTLGKTVWWNGTNWIDATGTLV